MTGRERHGKTWLREEEDQLLHEFDQRMHPRDIAAAHGRTTNAILGKLRSLGLVMEWGRGYRRVEADEWISFAEVREAKIEEGGE